MNQQSFDPENEVPEEITDVSYDPWRDVAIRFRQDGGIDAAPSQIDAAISSLHDALKFAGEKGMTQGEIEQFFAEDAGLPLTPRQVNTLIDIMAFDFGLVFDDGSDSVFLDEAFGHVVKAPEGRVGIADEGPGDKTTYDEDAKEGFWSAPEVFSETTMIDKNEKVLHQFIKNVLTEHLKV